MEIVQVVAQAPEDTVTVLDVEFDFNAGMQSAELAEGLGQEVLGCGDYRDTEVPAAQGPYVVDRGLEARPQGREFGAGVVEKAPDVGEVHAAPSLLEERAPDRLGEAFYLDRDGGLGEVQRFGGSGEAAMAGHGLENLQLPEGGVAHALIHR